MSHLSIILWLIWNNPEVSFFLVSIQGTFDGINIRNVENVIKDSSSCGFVTSSEPVRSIIKSMVIFADQHRKYFDGVAVLRGRIAVEEGS